MPTNDSIIEIVEIIDSTVATVVADAEPSAMVIKDTIIQEVMAPAASPTVNITNQSLDLNISPLVIIAVIGLGIGLYFLLAFLKKYILPVFIQRYQKVNIKLFWFRFSTLIWFAFGLLALYVFLKGSVIITAITIITVGAILHNFIYDFMLGIYFQFENHIKRKAQFRLGDIEGEVHSFYTRHLKVIDDQAEEVLIPFRNLLNQPVRIVKQIDSLIEKSFQLNISGDPTKNLQMLEKFMTMCPWIHDRSLYKVTHLSAGNYQISVRVKEAFTANKIETFMLGKVG